MRACLPAAPVSSSSSRTQQRLRTLAAAAPMAHVASSDAETSALRDAAFVWAATHGLVVSAPGEGTLTHAPLSLRPTPFPRAAFKAAVSLAAPFAALYAAVAADIGYLEAVLAPAAQHDAFTARLLRLLRAHPPRPDALRLGLLRSDYMVDEPTGKLLQVEINTVSASFAALASLTSRLHAHLACYQQRDAPPGGGVGGALPPNEAGAGFAAGLAAAWAAAEMPDAVVLFVVQPGERNVFDQQALQAALWEAHGVRTVRATLAQVAASATLDEAQGGNGRALRFGGETVSVVYFRAGYTPDDFPTETEWEAREMLEASCAVKCPDVALHLAGAKKVQQHLAKPGEVERFLSAADSAAVRSAFAGLWALDGPDVAAVAAMATSQPDGFVLKPQREGGGNNIYGSAMAERLSAPSPDLGAFILMQRIRPAVHPALFMRAGQVAARDSLTELGIYSVWLSRGGAVLCNSVVGHLLRTKTADSDEGGVAAGYAVLDSPRLV